MELGQKHKETHRTLVESYFLKDRIKDDLPNHTGLTQSIENWSNEVEKDFTKYNIILGLGESKAPDLEGVNTV